MTVSSSSFTLQIFRSVFLAAAASALVEVSRTYKVGSFQEKKEQKIHPKFPINRT